MLIGTYAMGLTLVVLSVLLSVLGLLLARKILHLGHLKASHEVGGYLLSVVGTMYAVLLGLVVVDAMGRFQQAITITEQEANALADIFLLSERMPEERAGSVQRLCHQYADLVVRNEWKSMDQACVCLDARKTAIALVRDIRDWEPVTESQKAIYPLAIQEACQLWDCRRARTNLSKHSIPALEWWSLVLGGVLTVLFTYFFRIDNLSYQIAMTAMVSTIIALNLFLVLMFGYPFSGELKVSPEAFELDKRIFEDKLGFNPSSNS